MLTNKHWKYDNQFDRLLFLENFFETAVLQKKNPVHNPYYLESAKKWHKWHKIRCETLLLNNVDETIPCELMPVLCTNVIKCTSTEFGYCFVYPIANFGNLNKISKIHKKPCKIIIARRNKASKILLSKILLLPLACPKINTVHVQTC